MTAKEATQLRINQFPESLIHNVINLEPDKLLVTNSGHTNQKLELTTQQVPSWKDLLKNEFEESYYKELRDFVKSERAKGKIIYPSDRDIFNALSYTPFASVKVVILGQDPYHGPNQAHGLCFSVLEPTPAPPSLKNIFKELNSDLGIARPNHGSLEKWARRGVLLLNAILSVESGRPASHQNKGWERFTDKVIDLLNTERSALVYLLWGASAQKKGARINSNKNLVLRAAHPSPLSAHNGFFGCKHFSMANRYLASNGVPPVDWSL